MSLVEVEMTFAAPPQRVWDTIMDPHRLGDWVTIHRELKKASDGAPRTGATMEQVLQLHGVHFTVKWRLVECAAPRLAEWEGKGPAASRARTIYELTARGEDSTRFRYTNEFTAPGGMLGNVASRVLVGGASEREAQASLRRLKSLVERSPQSPSQV